MGGALAVAMAPLLSSAWPPRALPTQRHRSFSGWRQRQRPTPHQRPVQPAAPVDIRATSMMSQTSFVPTWHQAR